MRYTKLLVLFLALIFVVMGCSKQDKTIVAKINDQTVTWKEYNDVLTYYLDQYGITDVNDAANAETVSYLKTSILDSLIDEKVQYVKAVELGLDVLTDDDKDQIELSVIQLTDNWKNQFNAQAASQYANHSEQQQIDKAREMYADFVKNTGYTDEYVTEIETRRLILNKLFNQVTEGVEPDEEQLQAAYAENLQYAKEEYAETPSYYENDCLDDSMLIYYHPPGFRRVKHILIGIVDTVANEIMGLRRDGDNAAADAMRDEALQGIRGEAEEVLASLKADGSNFDEVMYAKSIDPGSLNYPGGYVTYEGSTTFVPEFVAGVFAIDKVGDISPLIGTDYGYHIIRWEEDIESREVPYEDVQYMLRQQVWDANRSEMFGELVTQWYDEMTIERFEDRL